MAKNTTIAWTHHTFNPWLGCDPVPDSPACDHCYNKGSVWPRLGVGPGLPRRRTGAAYWQQPMAWDREAAKTGVKQRVFCGSACDYLDQHPTIRLEWRGELWDLIRKTPNLIWMMLTKRIEHFMPVTQELWGRWGAVSLEDMANVRLGVTAENQEQWDKRVTMLRRFHCAGRFVSCEPLLGRIDAGQGGLEGIDWVIGGGESGPKARISHPLWARFLREQCGVAVVPFMWKQWGEWGPDISQYHGPKLLPQQVAWCNEDGSVRTVGTAGLNCDSPQLSHWIGKKAAGHILDGVEYMQIPEKFR